ncbi:hypothetical protein IW152_000184 [Coemansia sp. BCRC 34962]|nr:hypothetical protein IW152_000184 [Coemansia sp. BCRC 34962]
MSYHQTQPLYTKGITIFVKNGSVQSVVELPLAYDSEMKDVISHMQLIFCEEKERFGYMQPIFNKKQAISLVQDETGQRYDATSLETLGKVICKGIDFTISIVKEEPNTEEEQDEQDEQVKWGCTIS